MEQERRRVMDKTECQKLAERLEKMAKGGLLDVKFYAAGEAATEQVCREANRLYQALEQGEAADVDFKDSYGRKPKKD
jgi:hypothetical protein